MYNETAHLYVDIPEKFPSRNGNLCKFWFLFGRFGIQISRSDVSVPIYRFILWNHSIVFVVIISVFKGLWFHRRVIRVVQVGYSVDFIMLPSYF